LRRGYITADEAWDAGEFFSVTYVPDAVSDKRIRKLEDIQKGN
jgi:hypothetical protein